MYENRPKSHEVRETMMSSGMHKPPLPPKPKLAQPRSQALPPITPKRNGPLSPGKLRMVKPIPAPKPCLPKHTTAVEPIPIASESLSQTPVRRTARTPGLLQQENKKPDWDYIIPICLCSDENCMCIKNTSASIDKMDKDLKMLFKGKPEGLLPASGDTTDNCGEKMISSSTNLHHVHHKPLLETFTADRYLHTDTSGVAVEPSLPHRAGSDEANGKEIPQSAPGRGPGDDALGSEPIYSLPRSKPVPGDPRKRAHVPVPRKPRMPVLNHQEREEGKVENVNQEGRDVNVKEAKVPSEGKDNPSLSAPENALTSAAQMDEEDLDLDSSSHDMEVSIDPDDDDDEVVTEGAQDQEAVYTEFTHNPPSSGLLGRQELGCPPAAAVAAAGGPVGMSLRKPKRHNSMVVSIHRKNEPYEEKEEGSLGDAKWLVLPVEGYVAKERQKREMSLPQAERKSTARAIKPARPSLGKLKAKSFSAADFMRYDRQKGNSFQKLLDLKLAVKMLPKIIRRGAQSVEHSANDTSEQDGRGSVHQHLGAERESFFPLGKGEQSVDGDDFSPESEQEPYYENISHYEEIPIYMNVVEGRAQRASTSHSVPAFCPRQVCNDEGIYEEHDPYMSFGHEWCQSPTDHERSSVDEEVTPPDDGPLDYVSIALSDEEDDSSPVSSKGDPEQAEQSPKSAQKRSKIHYIAKEIMSSESVFVDVLKLLHVDFRDAVSRASRGNGRPVIEERLLDQILYYLPQLYELNQDLLQELQRRVAQWDEKPRLADIFLKIGPYLKMYSTYISGFDGNVALLVEQSKRNPAFGAVVRDFEASPRCANLAVKDYLLKPIQRIPQYQLLLTDYLKNLSEDSDDYNDTQAALALVKDVASHANDILKQGDNFQKLILVQCNLTSHHEIVLPGRIFLKEGILKKLSRKVMQPRMFFLFNDTLLCTIPVQSGQYKFKNMRSLAGMKVSKPSQEAYQNELNVESVERSFTLSAGSAAERDEWLEAITTAINDYTKKTISFISDKPPEGVVLQNCGDGTPLGSKAPIWIPDPRTTMCMICTCEFTLTWRRHHCRACGKVVCQSCSSNKHHLEYLKNQLARVCDPCFLVLRQQTSTQYPSTVASTVSRAHFPFNRKQKKIPATLKEVSASTHSSMSGYLQISKSKKKEGKKRWFVIKDKVLYTYAASEDIAALESQPLLGFVLKVDPAQKLQFKLYHKNTLYYMFKAEDIPTAQRWIDSFIEATVL